jgi:hypothetical protein
MDETRGMRDSPIIIAMMAMASAIGKANLGMARIGSRRNGAARFP